MEEGEVAGEIKVTHAGAMKKGSFMIIDGVACRVTDTQTSKPGKHGAAKARIVAVGIFDKKKYPHVSPVSAQIQIPLIDKRVGSVISKTESITQVMDSETFEVFDVSQIEDEVKDKVAQGQDVEYWKVMDRTIIVRIKS